MDSKIKKEDDIEGVKYFGFDDDISSSNLNQSSLDNNIKDYDKAILNINIDKPSIVSEDIKPFLNESDILDIIDTTKFKSNFLAEENLRPSNLIKKEDSIKKKVMNPIDFKNELSKSMNFTNEDWSESIEEILESDLLGDDFLDFIELPKISGDRRNLIGKNLISRDNVNSVTKKVEITDNPAPEESEHSTSIEINRNEFGDIESISVYCKCGEITDIKFDYDDDVEANKVEYVHTSGNMDNLKLNEIKPL